jgi:hypothetical protein
VPAEESRPIIFTGTIIESNAGLFIDNGKDRYLIEGELSHGSEVTVTGTLTGSRITPEQVKPATLIQEDILAEIQQFVKKTQP